MARHTRNVLVPGDSWSVFSIRGGHRRSLTLSWVLTVFLRSKGHHAESQKLLTACDRNIVSWDSDETYLGSLEERKDPDETSGGPQRVGRIRAGDS